MHSDMGFPHIKKNLFCDLSRAQIILWGHVCQNISEIFCENFLTVKLCVWSFSLMCLYEVVGYPPDDWVDGENSVAVYSQN